MSVSLRPRSLLKVYSFFPKSNNFIVFIGLQPKIHHIQNIDNQNSYATVNNILLINIKR